MDGNGKAYTGVGKDRKAYTGAAIRFAPRPRYVSLYTIFLDFYS